VSEAERDVADGAPGDALTHLDADALRNIAATCLDIVADLEDRTAALLGDPKTSTALDMRRFWVRKQLAARERAAKARKRKRLLLKDTSEHKNEDEWWDGVRVFGQT
jgi:hypothetical protein